MKDNTKHSIIFGIIFLSIFIGIALTWEKKARGACHIYKTVKGDTLGKLSKDFYGSRSYWRDIKAQNFLKRNTLPIGLELYIYVPDKDDWQKACKSIILQRIKKKRIDASKYHYIWSKTIKGIIKANDTMREPLDPIELVEACRLATATAEQESMYEFAIGGAGEVGPFQFKMTTARMTLKAYRKYKDISLTDKTIVQMLLNYDIATMVFVLHYYDLLKRCKDNKWCAWKRYNNGSEAAAYASKAMKRYQEIRLLQPEMCIH